MAFLLNVNYMNGMEAQALVHTSIVSGIIVLVDTLLKVRVVFIHIHTICACSVHI